MLVREHMGNSANDSFRLDRQWIPEVLSSIHIPYHISLYHIFVPSASSASRATNRKTLKPGISCVAVAARAATLVKTDCMDKQGLNCALNPVMSFWIKTHVLPRKNPFYSWLSSKHRYKSDISRCNVPSYFWIFVSYFCVLSRLFMFQDLNLMQTLPSIKKV